MIFFPKRFRLTRGFVPLFVFILSLSSCSLNYGDDSENDTKYPEFAFYDAKLIRFEKARKTVELSAERIEKYRGSNASFAKNASFSTWNSNGSAQNEGKCTLLKADSDEKKYIMLDGIMLKSESHNFTIEASSLFYDGKTEQMVSGENELVILKRNDLLMEGRGFSASGIDKSFRFSGLVDGSITTEESNEIAE